MHVKLQKKLIEELRSIDKSQLFIISHNDRFLNEVQDRELLFVNQEAKQAGVVKALSDGCKNLVLNNLAGEVRNIDRLRYIDKIIILEGKSDKQFFDILIPKYCSLLAKTRPCVYFDKINGIDNMKDKLLTYSLAFDGIVPETAKWIVIRDTDCIPISRKEDVKNSNLGYLRASLKDLYFQNGYGIESTFVAEPSKLAILLMKYYELNDVENSTINVMIEELNESFAERVLRCTDSVYQELEAHFLRQKDQRKEKIYESLKLQDMLNEINSQNIQYIMTKPILEMYLGELHEKMIANYSTTKQVLKRDTIMDFYYNNISTIDDIFENHKQLLELIIST